MAAGKLKDWHHKYTLTQFNEVGRYKHQLNFITFANRNSQIGIRKFKNRKSTCQTA